MLSGLEWRPWQSYGIPMSPISSYSAEAWELKPGQLGPETSTLTIVLFCPPQLTFLLHSMTLVNSSILCDSVTWTTFRFGHPVISLSLSLSLTYTHTHAYTYSLSLSLSLFQSDTFWWKASWRDRHRKKDWAQIFSKLATDVKLSLVSDFES